jgi:hypothetical protein
VWALLGSGEEEGLMKQAAQVLGREEGRDGERNTEGEEVVMEVLGGDRTKERERRGLQGK